MQSIVQYFLFQKLLTLIFSGWYPDYATYFGASQPYFNTGSVGLNTVQQPDSKSSTCTKWNQITGRWICMQYLVNDYINPNGL